MNPLLASADQAILIVVDMQPSFLKSIWEGDRVVRRTEFVLRAAQILDIPVVATEQNLERMGATHPALAPLLSDPPISKMSFSCARCPEFESRIEGTARRQAVLVGIETHICISQTAHHLLQQGGNVFICGDAVSARTEDRHLTGLARMSFAGAVICHSESIIYEWLESAAHPKFREVLGVVKEFS